jgi:putative ABC transport system permease protein
LLQVDGYREERVEVEGSDGPTPALMAVVKGAPRDNVQFLGGESARKLREVFSNGAVAVTESFARRFQVKAGDQLRVRTPRGIAAFAIAGVYTDYSRDQGVILLEAANYARHFGDKPVQSLAVYLKDEADLSKLSSEFTARFSSRGEFLVYSNRSLRERILAIFDQTFAVTYVLRTVAIIVAITGIFLSVTTMVAERERELGVLRAIGAARSQIQQLFMTEAALIGCVASLLGMIAGGLLAIVLTWVVNPAFFGWTIALQVPWAVVFATPLWIVPAALGASWWPAWSGSRKPISGAIREE